MPSGPQRKFNSAIADQIVSSLSEGQALAEIAEKIGFNVRTITTWMLEDAEFQNRCSGARQIACDLAVDNLNRIAESEPDTNRARLLCDNIKWVAARRHPKTYGDRLDLSVTQTVDISGALSEAAKRILLPRRDLENVVEAEVIDITTQRLDSNTDSQSVDASKTEENQDLLDIFD